LANIIVFVEVRGQATTVASRFAVAEARRVASELGATVYAVIATGPASEEAIEAHGKVIGQAAPTGSCAARTRPGRSPAGRRGGPVPGRPGPAAAAVVTLFPAGAIGPALGAPLAMRMGGLFHPRASLEVVRDGGSARLAVRRFRGDGAVRTLDVAARTGGPTVATLPAGAEPGPRGAPAVEVEMPPLRRRRWTGRA
jgi:hypothetical protein